MLKFRLNLNKYKIPAVLFGSRFFYYPECNTDINVVVGSPIAFPKIENP